MLVAASALATGAAAASGHPAEPDARGGGAAQVGTAASRAVPMPKDCGALTTIVADQSLRFGIIDGASGEQVEAGLRLDFQPRAATYVVSSTNRGITLRRLLVTSTDGRLHLITLQDRVDPATKKQITTSAVTVIGSGWGDVRLLVSSYPYVYGVNDAGALKRYQMTTTWGIASAGTVRKSGWNQIVSLSRGDLWNLGKDAKGRTRYGDDIVGVMSTGAVRAYLIPRDTYQSLAVFTLIPKGWGDYAHVSVGSCDTGKSRPIVAVKKDGQVQAYLDVNGDDQRGTDIRWVGTLTRGWTGLLAD
ncbi:MAG: hypothetical protein IPI32_08210 [Austwickia sp.]|nr:hypothetical protein [Austwickia sp.]MBK9102212.1 hypothetical protein [Austwickia sp.]